MSWLDGWKVQLPVNSSGKKEGKAVTNWPPDKNKKPWYRLNRKTQYFKCPDEGASTSPGRAPRCEMAQSATWHEGDCRIKVKVTRCEGDKTTVFQVREKGGGDELVNIRFRHGLPFEIWLNNYQNYFDGPVGYIDQSFYVRCRIKNGGSIRLRIGGVDYKVKLAKKYSKKFQFKFGLYGRAKAESKVSKLKVSMK